MVQGIEKFRGFLEEFNEHYVLIGGMACLIIMEDLGVSFRATKDYDLVLIAELSTDEFYKKLWELIEAGEYENRLRGNGKPQFYRFTKPNSKEYPYMIELFSRAPDGVEISKLSELTPIPTGEDLESLSAILLDSDYYELVKEGKKIVDGVSVLGEEYLILMKMKAWLDLDSRKKNGERIDGKNVSKHKKDVFRLLTIIDTEKRVEISDEISSDIEEFLDKVSEEPIKLKDLGIRTITFEQAIAMLKTIYSK